MTVFNTPEKASAARHAVLHRVVLPFACAFVAHKLSVAKFRPREMHVR